MKRKRRHLSATFKAKVAKEAIRGERSVNDIALQYEVAPAQVSQWKKEALDRLDEIFASKGDGKKELKRAQRNQATMERKIGQLLLEKDFLVKKCVQLGIDPSVRP